MIISLYLTWFVFFYYDNNKDNIAFVEVGLAFQTSQFRQLWKYLHSSDKHVFACVSEKFKSG